jgi:hypothetical protein
MSRNRSSDLGLGALRIRSAEEAKVIGCGSDPITAALTTPPAAMTEVGAGGEIIPTGEGALHLRNTLKHPSYVTLDASKDRLDLAYQADVLEAALDLSETIIAENSVEKMLAAQMALLHKATMRIGTRLLGVTHQMGSVTDQDRYDAMTNQIVRLANAVTRATAEFQGAGLTLQKLRTGGRQLLTVQHVTVKDGGQAVVTGPITGGKPE